MAENKNYCLLLDEIIEDGKACEIARDRNLGTTEGLDPEASAALHWFLDILDICDTRRIPRERLPYFGETLYTIANVGTLCHDFGAGYYYFVKHERAFSELQK